ncbi:hypothetical protein N658DRAFT_527798 [Parathielavia hyrcaniae]|uniref:Uncharacterized protein n=1 Tax=Parathielavia hyrcaniae TaxID=113614 RepID=A0AAN6PVK6_9PEZI|nr:hypothetical protein N658DRAFT_527798 [Parathielavia hyrcaniae]
MSMQPELAPYDGLEVCPGSAPEVVSGQHASEKKLSLAARSDETGAPRKRICGLSKFMFSLMLAVAINLPVALGLGLGIAMTRTLNSIPSYNGSLVVGPTHASSSSSSSSIPTTEASGSLSSTRRTTSMSSTSTASTRSALHPHPSELQITIVDSQAALGILR